MLTAMAGALRERLLSLFRRPIDEPLEDGEFDDLARQVFRFQFERNAPYAAWCRTRGATPDSVEHWSAIPAVPTAAFKHVALVAGSPEDAQAVFRTSGTTQGRERRGVHHVLDLALYHGSALPTFAAFLLPDGLRPTMLSLLPPETELPDSSLAHMVGAVLREFGDEHSGCFASLARGIQQPKLVQALEQAAADARPVCLLGTSLSFVHFLGSLRDTGTRLPLPAGSRLMDTGGYKGREDTVPVSAAQLLDWYGELLALEPACCVNEYGMTELLSQYYDAAFRDRVLGRAGEPRKAGPPWLRTRVVDPETLLPAPKGATGLLQHFDLANLGSVMAVQTEDLGVLVPGGFRLLGRVTAAPPRGCSIAMDDLLRAARAHRP